MPHKSRNRPTHVSRFETMAMTWQASAPTLALQLLPAGILRGNRDFLVAGRGDKFENLSVEFLVTLLQSLFLIIWQESPIIN